MIVATTGTLSWWPSGVPGRIIFLLIIYLTYLFSLIGVHAKVKSATCRSPKMPNRRPRKTNLQLNIEGQEKQSGWSQRTVQAHRDFKRWCIQQGIVLSFNYDNLAEFLCSFVEKRKGSTKSLRNMFSALRTHERKVVTNGLITKTSIS